MSLSNAATYFDELWQGTSKADKYSAKNGKTFLIVGYGGNDTLNGANKDDKLEGKDGNDKIAGLDGNDTLQGHDGNDKLNGGNGNDYLDGGDDNDTIIGGKGNDFFEADDGEKEWTGGKGKDTFEIDDDDDFFARITDFGKKDKLQIDEDFEGFEDFQQKVVGGNLRITLDGDYVAELMGVTKKLGNSNIVWDD